MSNVVSLAPYLAARAINPKPKPIFRSHDLIPLRRGGKGKHGRIAYGPRKLSLMIGEVSDRYLLSAGEISRRVKRHEFPAPKTDRRGRRRWVVADLNVFDATKKVERRLPDPWE